MMFNTLQDKPIARAGQGRGTTSSSPAGLRRTPPPPRSGRLLRRQSVSPVRLRHRRPVGTGPWRRERAVLRMLGEIGDVSGTIDKFVEEGRTR